MCLTIHSIAQEMEPKLGLEDLHRELFISREATPLPQYQPAMLSQVFFKAIDQSNGSQNFVCIRIIRRTLLKHRLVAPIPRRSDSVGLEWAPRICASNSSQVMPMLLVCVPHLENHWSRTRLSSVVATRQAHVAIKYLKYT